VPAAAAKFEEKNEEHLLDLARLNFPAKHKDPSRVGLKV